MSRVMQRMVPIGTGAAVGDAESILFACCVAAFLGNIANGNVANLRVWS
jgi:hypothetical protein